MNKKLLNHLSESIYNFISDYRDYSNWYYYNNEIRNVDTVKTILTDEDNGLDFMDDLSSMFIFLTREKDFSNPDEEKLFDDLCSIFKEYNKYQHSQEKEYDIDSLAWKLVYYTKDSDPDNYKDCYNSDEVAFNHTVRCLSSNDGIFSTIESLCSDLNHYAEETDLTDEKTAEYFSRASDLLKEVSIFSKTLEKEDLEI